MLGVANPGLDPCAVHHKLGSMAHLTCERLSRTVKWSDGDGRTLVGVGDRDREVRTCEFIPEPLRGNRSDGAF